MSERQKASWWVDTSRVTHQRPHVYIHETQLAFIQRALKEASWADMDTGESIYEEVRLTPNARQWRSRSQARFDESLRVLYMLKDEEAIELRAQLYAQRERELGPGDDESIQAYSRRISPEDDGNCRRVWYNRAKDSGAMEVDGGGSILKCARAFGRVTVRTAGFSWERKRLLQEHAEQPVYARVSGKDGRG